VFTIAPPPLLEHLTNGMTHGEKSSSETDAKHSLPDGEIDVEQVCVPGQRDISNIVVKTVELTIFVYGMIDHSCDRLFVCNVKPERDSRPASRPDRLRVSAGPIFVDVSHNFGAALGKLKRRCRADAERRAGDDYDLVVQTLHLLLRRSLWYRYS
jgi:hypothetical protein